MKIAFKDEQKSVDRLVYFMIVLVVAFFVCFFVVGLAIETVAFLIIALATSIFALLKQRQIDGWRKNLQQDEKLSMKYRIY